ncbi:MAG: T9SS type A sorting domain-containing protein [Lentimicrobium sp.]|jgi:hypothetical protein|nr:T9SS type A sorting domain-containing protein [Lentimicrobium sp.]
MKHRSISFLLGLLLMQGTVVLQAQDLRFSKVFYHPNYGMHVLASAEAGQDSLLLISAGGEGADYGAVHLMDAQGVMHWSKRLTGKANLVLPIDVVRTADKNFFICAFEYSYDTYNYSFLLIKLSVAGDLLWMKKFEHESNVYPSGITLTSNGDILVTGRTSLIEPPYSSKLLLARFTPDGSLLWAKTYEAGTLKDEGTAVAELANGQLIIGGITKGSSPNGDEISLTQTYANGDVLWAKRGNYPSSKVNDLIAGPAGFYLSGDAWDIEGFVMSFNTDGEIIWSKSYAMYSWNEPVYRGRIKTTAGGNLLLSTGSFMGDGMVCQLTPEGIPVWVQYVFMQAMEACPISDGGYLFLGNGPIIGVKDVYEPQTGVIRTNALGEGIACTSEGGVNFEDYVPVLENIAYTVTNVGSVNDYSLLWEDIELNSFDGCVAFFGGVEQTPDAVSALSVYPNPGQGPFRLQHENLQPESLVLLTVYNNKGQCIFSRNGNWGRLQMIDRELPAGLYVVNVKTANNAFSTRFIVK